MRKLLIALISSVALLGPHSAGAVIIGTAAPDTGNCYPNGCNGWEPEYKQVIGSSYLTDVDTISSLTFFNTVLDRGSSNLSWTGLTITLGTTTSSENGLISISDPTEVFSGNISFDHEFGDSIEYIFDDLYDVDHTKDLAFMFTGSLTSTNNIFFDMDTGPGDGLWRNFSNRSDVRSLVVGVTGASVPEPSLVILMGLGLLGFVVKRRKI